MGLEELGWTVWTRFIWFRIGTDGGLLSWHIVVTTFSEGKFIPGLN
jgi:hypothetical protein